MPSEIGPHPGERRRCHFGPFTLDLSSLELRRAGEGVHLPRQPARVLRLLVANAGRLVTREEIRRHCWPETIYGVDPALNAAIRQIRRALGDSAAEPEYIETMPRRGYRFVAPVAVAGNRRGLAPRRSRLVPLVALAVFFLAVLIGHSEQRSIPGPESLPDALRVSYSQATVLLESGDPEKVSESLELFREVATARPQFTPAWAGLSEAFFQTGRREAARAAARQALGRTPELAGAHHILGVVRLVEDWDFAGAVESLRQAVALAPEETEYRISLAFALIALGADDEAADLLDDVYREDPVRFALKADAGWMEYLLGRYERSLELCGAAVEVAPDNLWAEDCATADLVRLGRYEEAVLRTEAALDRWGFADAKRPWAPGASAIGKLRGYWAWRAARLEQRGAAGSFYRLATLYSDLGRADDALRALEAAAAERSLAVVVARAEPSFEALRGRSRFQALLRTGGPADATAESREAPQGPVAAPARTRSGDFISN